MLCEFFFNLIEGRKCSTGLTSVKFDYFSINVLKQSLGLGEINGSVVKVLFMKLVWFREATGEG